MHFSMGHYREKCHLNFFLHCRFELWTGSASRIWTKNRLLLFRASAEAIYRMTYCLDTGLMSKRLRVNFEITKISINNLKLQFLAHNITLTFQCYNRYGY